MSRQSISDRASSAAHTPPPPVPHSQSPSTSPRPRSSLQTTASYTSLDRPPQRRPPRSLPPWIDSYAIDSDSDEIGYDTAPPTHDDNDDARPLQTPPPALAPTKQGIPTEPARRRVSRDGFVDEDDPLNHRALQPRLWLPDFIARHAAGHHRGRKWDHLRNAEPVIVATSTMRATTTTTAAATRTTPEAAAWASSPWGARTTGATPSHMPSATSHRLTNTTTTTTTTLRSPTWDDFLRSSAYGRGSGQTWDAHDPDPDILNRLQPDFDKPVQMDTSLSGRQMPRARVAHWLWHTLLFHPWSPFLIRTVAIWLSAISLALACRLLRLSEPPHAPDPRDDLDQDAEAARAQSLFSLVVDVLLIPYVAYMLVDEYRGKPLGLRSTVQKTWLILADVLFIILKAAAAALATEALVLNRNDHVWRDHVGPLFAALAAFLVISLVVWSATLVANVFRMVERLGGTSRGSGILGSHGWEHRFVREYMV